MTTIPRRELRNNVSDVLRRAEQGERFTITVAGRPVAELSRRLARDAERRSPIYSASSRRALSIRSGRTISSG